MKDTGEMSVRNDGVTVDVPSIGLGCMRTSATYAALIIQLEGERHGQIDVLDSVMEALGITPEEIAHNRKRPDCVYETEYSKWADEAARLAERAKRTGCDHE